MAADEPGTGTTLRPAARTASTMRAPGSDTAGVPASDTSATRSPARRRTTSFSATSRSLCWCAASICLFRPKRVSSAPVLRVSSQATTSASNSTCSARSVMSVTLPMGVATT